MIGDLSPWRCTTSTCCRLSLEAGLGLEKDDAYDEATKRQTRRSSDAFAMVVFFRDSEMMMMMLPQYSVPIPTKARSGESPPLSMQDSFVDSDRANSRSAASNVFSGSGRLNELIGTC